MRDEKEILLTRMFAGCYCEKRKNIGYESINLFRDDNNENYIFITPYRTVREIMKFTTKKGLVALVLVLITMCGIFAQSIEYTTLFEQAKNYEAEKKYVYALCTYYDVLISNSTNSKAAYERYTAIEKTILSGKPGFDKYNEFTLYDGWVALRIEFEKYWSENSTCYFETGPIKKGDVNYENRTAEYIVSLKTEYTEKYNRINNIFKTGFDKVKKDDWGFSWNRNTIFSSKIFSSENESISDIYKKYGVALVEYPYAECSIEIYAPPFSYNDGLRGLYVHPSLTTSSFVRYITLFWHFDERYDFYLIKLSIYDSKNEFLLSLYFDAPVQGKEWDYTFEDVDSSTMAKIDAGGCYARVDEILLNYGDYSFAEVNGKIGLQGDLKQIRLPLITDQDNSNNVVSLLKKYLYERYSDISELKGTEYYIKYSVCSLVKESKKVTQEELIEYAKEAWKTWYDFGKEKFESHSEEFSFPEYDESYAETVYKNEIENILVTTNKKGVFVLTPEGRNFVKKR